MKLNFKKLVNHAVIPQFATIGSAGLDLCATEPYSIGAGQRVLCKTGLAVEIPSGLVGMVCSRSGLAFKNGVFVLNAPGIIDSDYRGELGVILQNSGDTEFLVSVGDRIAQLVIAPVLDHSVASFSINEVLDVTDTTRGTGGFGSTGTK